MWVIAQFASRAARVTPQSMKRTTAILTASVLGACATATPPGPVLDRDPYTATAHLRFPSYERQVVSPYVAVSPVNVRSYSAAAVAEAAGGVWRPNLYVTVVADDWMFLDGVWRDGAFTRLERSSTDILASGRVVETVVIGLPGAHLRAYAADGLDVKLTGERGEAVVTIPASYFADVLQVLEATSAQQV